MFVAASLILVAGIVAVATPHTVHAAKAWCFKNIGGNLQCGAGGGATFFEKKADCRHFIEGMVVQEGCKRIDPTAVS